MSAGENELVREAAEAFIAELQHWRDVAGLAKKALSERMGYDPSYVGKIESGNARPTADFAKRADQVLHAGGALWRRWKEYDLTTRQASRERPVDVEDIKPVESMPAPATGLVVAHDHAELRYENGIYHATQRRKLRNVGQEPITRYLIRISVDRHPGDPERSNELYREHPLTWPELRLHAYCGDDEMAWRVKHDRDAFKEVWLLFENDYGHFPLYPGKSVWIKYGYGVSEQKWGRWFQRAVRLPTERLSVRLVFPRELEPKVWGMETSMTAEAHPFRTAIEQEEEDDYRVYCWATDTPPLHARYRLEWNFKAKREDDVTAATPPMKPSEKMASIGIRQKGSPILEQPTRPFDLPAEAEDARRVIAELHSAIERAMSIHHFAKGLGVAAPQIGIGRSAALVRTPDGAIVTLLNPKVIEESAETDEQYEGCWSFFDVRGKLSRPLCIHVAHQKIDGSAQITAFEGGVARLVAHEVDHLEGILYVSRLGADSALIPISEYSGTGSPW